MKLYHFADYCSARYREIAIEPYDTETTAEREWRHWYEARYLAVHGKMPDIAQHRGSWILRWADKNWKKYD